MRYIVEYTRRLYYIYIIIIRHITIYYYVEFTRIEIKHNIEKMSKYIDSILYE